MLDSNIIIYASKPENGFLRDFIRDELNYVSAVTKIEVLGYHKIKEEEYSLLKSLFEVAPLIKITDNIVENATDVRKQHNLSLGDSIIAATALVHDLELNTSNIRDFEKVSELALVDPFNYRKWCGNWLVANKGARDMTNAKYFNSFLPRFIQSLIHVSSASWRRACPTTGGKRGREREKFGKTEGKTATILQGITTILLIITTILLRISTVFQPCFYRISTSFQSHFYRVLTPFQPTNHE